MKTIQKTIRVAVVLTSAFTLAACSTPKLFSQSQENVNKVKTQIKDARQEGDTLTKPKSSVIVKDELYVDSVPINIKKQPTWLKGRISLHGDKLPFSFYSRNIVKSAGVLTKYQHRLDPSLEISMNYTGDIQGALDLLAAKTGYSYSINGDSVYWRAFETKTFNIAFMPGSSNYMVGKDKVTKKKEDDSNTNEVIKKGNDDTANDQYSNLQATLSVWKDMNNTIQSMLSKEGRVVVSESTSAITVTDHPSNLKTIGLYIDSTNADLSKQVMIKVQVLQINLQENFVNGINWDAAKTMLGGTDFTFSGNFAAPVAIAPIAGISTASFGAASGASQALITALSQQGRISTTTEPTVVTTNNQVATLGITTQTGYLAQVSSTISGDTGTLTTDVLPGQAITGLTLFILPKIMDNKVYLQVSSSLSTLQKIQDLYSQGTADNPNESATKIQAPIINDNSFNQRSVITSGTTLILAGFKQIHNEANNSAFAQIDALGGKGAAQQNIQTIILITPYILNNS